LSKLSNFTTLSSTELFIEVLLIEVMVISIVERRSDSVTRVPPSVTELTVVSVVSNDLCLCYFEARWVAHATGEIKHSSGIFPSQRGITIFSS